jgi:hypothetical protein
MRLAEPFPGPGIARTDVDAEITTAAVEGDWADQTRRVLTRDLLMRASRAQPAESHALEFRALHLNLPLVGEVADGLGIAETARPRVEHAALEGLLLAMRVFDPFGAEDFADFAVPFVEQRVMTQLPAARPAPQARRGMDGAGLLPRRPLRRQAALRLVVRRMAQVIVGRA